MKIVICPNSFKGALTSLEISSIIAKEIKKFIPSSEIIKFPIADGGDGTLEVLKNLIGGKYIKTFAKDPLGREIETKYLKKESIAYIEMAKISGLALLKENERNPMETTTYGLGELIKDAIKRKCKKIFIGVGGSATNEGGIGALTALGFKFIDKNGNILYPGKGRNLISIEKVEYPEEYENLKKVKFTILADVNNPLYGKNGASFVYGRQKGATEKMIKILDDGLRHYAKIIKKYTGIQVNKIKSSGAAGGIVAGFVSFLSADVVSGIEEILNLGSFESKIKDANLIITGEGKIDKQTFYGKGVGIILNYSIKYKIPTVVLAGKIEEEIYKFTNNPYISLFSIVQGPVSLEESIRKTRKYIKTKIREILKLILSLKKL
ncbi:MAG: glycerate kinase [Candidatus Omnitrophica bacterium]|nr:glycerate kinase [Candidatus Omnitrophota bacterium]